MKVKKNYFPWFSWYPFNFVLAGTRDQSWHGLSSFRYSSLLYSGMALRVCVCEQETIADMCRIKLILKYSHVVSRKSSFGILEQNILSSNLERMNLEFRNRWGFSLFYIWNQLHLVLNQKKNSEIFIDIIALIMKKMVNCFFFRGSIYHNLYLASLNLTSMTFAAALYNLSPAFTYIVALLFRWVLLLLLLIFLFI
jgi:hypothetical protein